MALAPWMSSAEPSAGGLTRRAFLGGAAATLSSLALAACASPKPAGQVLTLATGPEGAVFREIGAAYADAVNASWPAGEMLVRDTASSLENAQLLSAGEVDAALINVDVAAGFEGEIVALARVFDSVLHLVVPEGSDITDLRGLQGKTIAGGLELSGTRFTTSAILTELGVEANYVSLSQADSVAALAGGAVEAAASLTGMPTPAISEIGAGQRVRFIDLGSDAEHLIDRFSLVYFPVTIPSTMYEGLQAATTLAVPTVLAVRPGMPDALAEFLTACLFGNADALSHVRPEAGQINPRTGAGTTPIALHPGAAGWFRANKP